MFKYQKKKKGIWPKKEYDKKTREGVSEWPMQKGAVYISICSGVVDDSEDDGDLWWGTTVVVKGWQQMMICFRLLSFVHVMYLIYREGMERFLGKLLSDQKKIKFVGMRSYLENFENLEKGLKHEILEG